MISRRYDEYRLACFHGLIEAVKAVNAARCYRNADEKKYGDETK